MAFGLTPKYIEQIELGELTNKQFLVLAIEAAQQLKWGITNASDIGFTAYSNLSMSSTGEEITVRISSNEVTLKSVCSGSQLMDFGKNKKNVQKLIALIEDLKPLNNLENLELKYQAIQPNLLTLEQLEEIERPTTFKENFTGFLSIFIPKENYFVAPILININVLVFIVMLISGVHFMSPESEDLLAWGANFRPLTLSGEYWRLLTCCFLHIGVLHLLMNMFALFGIGILLEEYIGRARFLVAYLLTGIIASVTSIWWHNFTVSAGASGAIFGMYGLFIALLTTKLIEDSKRKPLLNNMLIFIGLNVVMGLSGPIDNAAHIGGLVSGIVIGYVYILSLREYNSQILKYGMLLILTFTTIVGSYFFMKTIHNHLPLYESRMERFSINEKKAIDALNNTDGLSRDSIMSNIKNEGIYNWNQNIALLDSNRGLDLDKNIKRTNSLLIEYSLLRVKSYELYFKVYEENTNKYNEEIKEYNTKIEKVLNQINVE
jgi:rhomboid protease GluP